MKNIHVLPTDKPSRLIKNNHSQLLLTIQTLPLDREIGCFPQNIYITSDDKIKEGDWFYDNDGELCKYTSDYTVDPNTWEDNKKIILTTDQELIKDSVQAIDDTFLKWFVKNPSCEKVIVEIDYNKFFKKGNITISNCYEIIIPKEPKPIKCYCGHTTYCDCSPLDEAPNMDKQVLIKMWESAMPKLETKKETLEEAFSQYVNEKYHSPTQGSIPDLESARFGAKWQQEQDRWKTVYEETPPIHVELLVKSPEGIVHLASWRESYNIFTCQAKSESSLDWKWKTI